MRDLDDVVVNETTLFNPETGDGGVLERSTWYFGAESADGTATDCIVAGDAPAHYADRCTNVFE